MRQFGTDRGARPGARRHRAAFPAAAAVAVGLLGAACQSDDPVRRPAGGEPPRPAATAVAHGTVVAPEAVALAEATLADARARVLPAMGDSAAQARLRAHLRDLAEALKAGDAEKARRDLRVARRVLRQYGVRSPDAAREVAPIALALDRVEQLLDQPPPRRDGAAAPAPAPPADDRRDR